MDNPFKSPAIISYCPGLLGLERGLKRVVGPVRTITYVEIEALIIENILAGMEAGILDAAPIWSNIKTFPAEIFRGKIHGFIGGYPCQPFSNAGKREGENDPRHLWPYLLSNTEAVRPLWLWLENVGGHLTLGFDEVYRSLSDLGYAVEAGIFTAEEVGAPHRRERLFILAIQKELADSDCIRHAYSEFEKQSTERRQHAFGDIATGCIKNVAYYTGERFQGYFDEGQKNTGTTKASSRSWFDGIHATHWPARPGEKQFEWENPRIIEPGLGCTINGYNFREDLLRALGNSVVEQCAEKAFIMLLKMHEQFQF